MGLFKPAWQSKDKVKAVEAVRKMTDQTELAHIAKGAGMPTYYEPVAKHIEVGIAAVEKLTDQILLTDVAVNAFRGEICIMALKKLTDQSLLIDIARNDSNDYVRFEAAINVIKRTTDSKLCDEMKKIKAETGQRIAQEEQDWKDRIADGYVKGQNCS